MSLADDVEALERLGLTVVETALLVAAEASRRAFLIEPPVPAGNDPSVCQMLPPLVLEDHDADEVIAAIAAVCSDALNQEIRP